eukprot:SAG31_NODE_13016_length_899_cov_1.255000_1_plen_153_part_00
MTIGPVREMQRALKMACPRVGALLLALFDAIYATPNAGAAPPMGWNSWESYEVGTSSELFINTASAMVKLGLPALGYTRFNTDAGWELLMFPNGTKRPCAARGPDGMLLADPAKFPHGLRPVAEHVNRLGKDCYFLVFVPTIREIRDFYREM